MNHIDQMKRRLRAYGKLPVQKSRPKPILKRTRAKKDKWISDFLDGLYALVGPLSPQKDLQEIAKSV